MLLTKLSGAVEEVAIGPDLDEDEVIAVLGVTDEIERDLTWELGIAFDRVVAEIGAVLGRRGISTERARAQTAEIKRQEEARFRELLAMTPEELAQRRAAIFGPVSELSPPERWKIR